MNVGRQQEFYRIGVIHASVPKHLSIQLALPIKDCNKRYTVL